MRKYSLIGLWVGVCLSTVGMAQRVDMVYTTESQRWVEPKKFMTKTEATAENTISVYPEETLQEMDGFGGAFNELGWDALSYLPQSESNKVFQEMFSEDGANFSMCRIPIGASDYALSYYSSNDVPEDFAMRDFNIDRDRYILIPFIKEALKVRPDLQVWGSPWSPPAWMKVNEHYAMRNGEFGNAKDGNKMNPGAKILNNATGFKMQERYLEAYALYFSKFVSVYANEGVPLFAIMPQNEIAFQPNWPSCTWRPEDMAYFIGEFLGPQFEKDGVASKIWLGSVNASDPNYVRTVLNNEKAQQYLAGVGFQWGGAKAIATIHDEYPQLQYMQTENKCGEHENDWTSVERSWKDLLHYINSGAGSYMYWNMILDETGSSAWGWPQNSMVVVDRDSKQVKYTDEYYLFKHISHFVQPGDRFLKSEGKNQLAFKKADGTVVVVLYNGAEQNSLRTVKIGDQKVNLDLKPRSISTVSISNY
ncbi:glycoside hydrolase family 30 beta sandwich domain-containing protein [Reichenbachiella sp. MSK19-1]|uniref:glycoside hydrolase family 30 protein n=1 Tax=Reichenbachiella sp. MSK19-1 TaxID=1897631 RepID=UPI000E6CC371|nr:glycoside hydrolase family 30 beta sandwich domain-containing protein [Reichenbachiella sp. MSK19-1]RJE74012.1 glycosyl hydrolase family 30 [Reichenbachiella sp. MSK19-1]